MACQREVLLVHVSGRSKVAFARFFVSELARAGGFQRSPTMGMQDQGQFEICAPGKPNPSESPEGK